VQPACTEGVTSCLQVDAAEDRWYIHTLSRSSCWFVQNLLLSNCQTPLKLAKLELLESRGTSDMQQTGLLPLACHSLTKNRASP